MAPVVFTLNLILDNPPKSLALDVYGSIRVSQLLEKLDIRHLHQNYQVFQANFGPPPPDGNADAIRDFIEREFKLTQIATMKPTDRIDKWFALADEMRLEDQKIAINEDSVQIFIMKDSSLGKNHRLCLNL